jgi:glucan biosynthesis protein C
VVTPSTLSSAVNRSKPQRSYYIDQLRVLATLLVFLYHCSRPFNAAENWHVKNNQVSLGFDVPLLVFGLWMMPLFFVLSGISTYYSLRSRGAVSFLRSRFLRLAVPLIGLGWFVLSPPQVYIERVTATGYHTTPFSGTFLQFIPEYFHFQYGAGGSFAFTGMHLWYLFYLFIFSYLALPLFVWLNSQAGRTLIGTLAKWAQKPGLILLPGLALCLFEVLQPKGYPWGAQEGGWYILTYLMLLIYCYVLAADERFQDAVDKHKGVALTLAVLTNALVAGLLIGEVFPSVARLFADWPELLWPILRTFSTWCWLVAVLGYGRKYLSIPHRLLPYAGEAVLPFYMLHQTVIVIIAFFIRNWAMAIGLKYLFVVCSAFVVIMLLYEFIIRRNRVARFLFGMPPARSKPGKA